MRNITRKITAPFLPKAVLVAYENGHNAYRLETREVLPDGTMGTAKCVSKEFAQALARTFSSEHADTPHGAMPRNLLYADTRATKKVFVWWNPPRKRTMIFTDRVTLEDGDYSVPGVIYMARGTDLFVYAFAGKAPTRRTRLLKGPFFNYYEDCRMCLGNSRRTFPKNGTWQQHLDAWETIFWNSANAHYISHPLTMDLCKALVRYKDEPFNTTVCRPAGLSLGELLDRLK